MQIRGGLPWQPPTGHLPLAPVTDFSVENREHKRTYLKPEPWSFEEPRGGWEGANKRQKAARQLQASHEGKTTWQWLECACATRSPADNRKSPS